MKVIIVNTESVSPKFDFENPSEKHLKKYGEEVSLEEFQDMFNQQDADMANCNIYFKNDNIQS